MNKLDICKLIIHSLKEFIATPDKMEAFREPKCFVRNRKLSMLNLIYFLLFNGKSALQGSISAVRDMLCDTTGFPNKLSKQAVSKARKGLSYKLFLMLFSLSVDMFYANINERKKWHGYHIFAIDGSKIELPNSKDNFDHFGEMFDSHNRDRKFTQALTSIVYDVLDDFIVHATFSHYLASERSQALNHMKELEDLNIYKDAIIVFDRGYYSEKMFRYCVDHDHLCVMRLKDSIGLAKRLEKSDADSYEGMDVILGNPKEGTTDVTVRVIAVKLDSGATEYLATNIFDENITSSMFRELYFLRWPCETKYYELKVISLLEEFSSATPNSIMQEFYISLLITNLSSLVKANADEEIKTRSRSTNKYQYQANRTFIIGRMRKLFIKIITGISEMTVIDTLLEDAYHSRSQIQPNRKDKRDKKKGKLRTHMRNRKAMPI